MKRLFALAAALLAAQVARADTLVDNVNGYTLDRNGNLMRFNGLVIDDQLGTVKQLLARKDKRPERPSFKVDGRDRTLIPGFIDSHAHLMALGLQATRLDLNGTASLQEAQSRIAAYAAANPNARWIVGSGWNEEKWNLGRFPTAADLDAILPGRPVWLLRADGHTGLANSAAMKEAGIGPGIASPPGGRVELAGKQPTGLFVDAATALVERVVPTPLPRARDEAIVKAQDLALAAGVTTVTDMGTDLLSWMAIRRAGDREALRIRIISYAEGVDTVLTVAGSGPTPWLYGGRLRMIGVTLSTDGALGPRGAWLKADYRDAPGQRGDALLNDAALKNLMSRAAMDNFQVAVSASGDAANTQALDAVQELATTYTGDRRWRVEGAEVVDPADLPRFSRFGAIASVQPAQLTSEWRMIEARMGPERLGGAFALGTMAQGRVPLALGSNAPAESLNPFAGLAAAVSREDAQGQPVGGWQPQQKLALVQAFAAYTSGPAYAAFSEDRLGTLERGKQADFLFVDRDIFAEGASAQLIRSTQVQETWIGGRRVWSKFGPMQVPAAPAQERGKPSDKKVER